MSDHVEVLRHMKETIKAIMPSEVAALDAAIAALSAPYPPSVGESDVVVQRLRGVLQHAKMGDKYLIADDLIHKAIDSITAPPSAPAGFDVRTFEAALTEYVEDYEFHGEDESGREGCYTPNERERLLIEDAIRGWEPPKPIAPQPPAEAQAQGGGEVVAWLGFKPRTGEPEMCTRTPSPSVMRDFKMRPLVYAAALAQQPDAGLDVEAVLRQFLTGDGFIAECDIQHIVAALTAQPAISGYTCTVPDDCETLHWRGQILSMNELASVAHSAPPSAPVGVDVGDKDCLTTRARELLADEYRKRGIGTGLVNDAGTATSVALAAIATALAQQPAAVDGAMVRRALCAWFGDPSGDGLDRGIPTVEEWFKRMEAALTAAQPGGSDNDR